MSPKHSNPTKPRPGDDGKIGARAPYNFVPLPEKIVPAREPLLHDVYNETEGLTGWIECELETCSPTYVRGMMTEEQFRRLGQKKPEDLKPEEKEELSEFFGLPGVELKGRVVPVIPGSSLRGMIRTLVEIAGYGRIRWVAKEPPITFRAVAAPREDPLSGPYRDVIGSVNATDVCAGYLEHKGNEWYVHPALTPQAMRPGDKPWLSVKDSMVVAVDLPGYIPFDDKKNYRPQVHQVSFDIKIENVKKGKATFVNNIGPRDGGYKCKGTMVCSGNMMEAGDETENESPRRKHAIVLPPDEKAKSLKINSQSIKDYLAGRTPFQRDKDKMKDWGGERWGCLKDGAPVFYVAEQNEVVYFGHSPNFRIPAILRGKGRAATPEDFIPQSLCSEKGADLADAIFGWVEESDVPPPGQRAGRVFFTDARFVEAKSGVWLKPTPITPHILSGPKPTTFQHYLVQDAGVKHDPDNKKSLAHFGSDPEKTQIRGFKFYWHKGSDPRIEASPEEREHETQLTRIAPIKPGVSFSFKIHFENLRDEELGAIWWTLALPGVSGRRYVHKIGMGKPLGMGAVEITPRLHLTSRKKRYEKLFAGETWHAPETAADAMPYLQAFEKYVLEENGIAPAMNSLAEVERIQMLLTLLEWREGDPDWLERTRYMEIKQKGGKADEYKERPVLPDPMAVVDDYRRSRGYESEFISENSGVHSDAPAHVHPSARRTS